MPYALTALSVLVALVLYFYHVVRRIAGDTTRLVATAAGCIVLLILPLGLDRLRLGTMAACSAAFMASLQLFHIMFRTTRSERLTWSFRTFLSGLFHSLVPIDYVPLEQRRSTRRLLRDNGRILARSLIDLYLTNVTWMWLIRCLGPGVEIVDEGYVLDVIYSTVFFIHLFSGAMFSYHMQQILVSMVTLDAYRVLAYYREPLLASSPRDFWSVRWNLQLKNILKTTVFHPLLRQWGSANTAAFAVFIVSGICHVYLVWVLFRTRLFHAFLFFVLHGLACAVETAFIRNEGRAPARLFNWFTWALFGSLTLPLYIGTFMRTAPLWLTGNMPDILLLNMIHLPHPPCIQ